MVSCKVISSALACDGVSTSSSPDNMAPSELKLIENNTENVYDTYHKKLCEALNDDIYN